MPIIIHSANELTPTHLTSWLTESNFLQHGRVASIQYEPIIGPFGKSHQLTHLNVQYTESGSQELPTRYFLKFGKSVKEAFFYNTIAKQMTFSPLLTCYHSSYNPQSDQVCLLLEDLSETHFQPEWPLPPSDDICFRIVQTLAQIHALWWQNPILARDFRPVIPPGRCWLDRRALAIEKLPSFLTFLGDRLSSPRKTVYEQLLASSSHIWEIPTNGSHQTLLHGDMHTWNVIYPRDPLGKLVFFDWNMWDIGCPTDDLAYLIGVHWYPERRKRLELILLKAYYDELVKSGITKYTWAELQQDYRNSIVRSLFIPVWQWVRGILPGIWWSHLERTFLAFEDLNCYDIIA
jgi:hypothetical protein